MKSSITTPKIAKLKVQLINIRCVIREGNLAERLVTSTVNKSMEASLHWTRAERSVRPLPLFLMLEAGDGREGTVILAPMLYLWHVLNLSRSHPRVQWGLFREHQPSLLRLHRSCPALWHLTDKFVFHLHQSQYCGFSVFGFSLCRCFWAVLQKGKCGHSGVLCRAVRYLHQHQLGCLLADIPLTWQPKSLCSSSVQHLSSLFMSWDADSSFLPGHTAALRCLLKEGTEFLSHSSLPGFLWKSKLHLSGPGKQVTSEIGVSHNPSLLTAEILPGFFDVSHPGALRHLLALCSQNVKVITVVFFGCYTGQLELLKISCYFTW